MNLFRLFSITDSSTKVMQRFQDTTCLTLSVRSQLHRLMTSDLLPFLPGQSGLEPLVQRQRAVLVDLDLAEEVKLHVVLSDHELLDLAVRPRLL